MRVFPTNKIEQKKSEPELTKIQIITRIVALIVAAVSVFFFFLKILFF